MATIEDYLALITAYHRGKPKFAATISATVAPFADGQGVLASFIPAFDLDTAVGKQLDTDGEWIGITRYVPQPVKGLYFALDDVARGFDAGVWRGPYDVSVALAALDDTTYRRLLKAKALANRWDGSLGAAQRVLDVYYTNPATQVRVVDTTGYSSPQTVFAFDRTGQGFDDGSWQVNLFSFDSNDNGFDNSRWLLPFEDDDSRHALDMGFEILVSGQTPNAIDLSILGNQLLPIRPNAISTDVYITSVSGASIFGFDIDNSNVSGFDTSAWAASPQYLAEQAL